MKPRLDAEFLSIKEDVENTFFGACSNNDLDACKALLSNQSLCPLLHEIDILTAAANYGSLELCEQIIGMGWSLKEVRLYRNSAFRNAAKNGHLHICKYLWSLGLTLRDIRMVDNFALREAAMNGHFHVVHYLLSLGLTLRDVRSYYGHVVWSAGKFGDIEFFKHLVSIGVDMTDVRGHKNEFRVLQVAAEQGHLEFIKYIVSVFSLSVDDIRISTALQVAASFGKMDVVDYLWSTFKMTADDFRTSSNYVLLQACSYNLPESVKFLLTKGGLTIHDLRTNNNAALEGAVWNGHFDIVKYLFSPGFLTKEDAKPMLRCACYRGHLQIVEFFVSSLGLSIEDTKLHNKSLDDGTPLMRKLDLVRLNSFCCASYAGHLDVLKVLVSLPGFTLDVLRLHNNHALQLAARQGHLEVVKYLVTDLKLTLDDIRNSEAFKVAEELRNRHGFYSDKEKLYDVCAFLKSQGLTGCKMTPLVLDQKYQPVPNHAALEKFGLTKLIAKKYPHPNANKILVIGGGYSSVIDK